MGISVWMDQDDLRYGRPWQPGVEKALREVNSAAILAGPSGIGEWQELEARLCLTQGLKCGIPVIPVLLPGGPSPENLPLFLREHTCADLRNDASGEHVRRLSHEILETREPLSATPAEPLRPFLEPRIQNPPLENLTREEAMESPASMAATWQTAYRRLSPKAAAILRLTAYLAPDPIPQEMFEADKTIGLLSEEISVKPGTGTIREALSELAASSLITKIGETFTVHPMIQEMLRAQIPEDQRQGWIERSLILVNDFSPARPDEVHTWPMWELLHPHALVVTDHADRAGISTPTAYLMGQLAVFFQAKGLYEEAEPLNRRALAIYETLGGLVGQAGVAICLNNLAQLLEDTNRLEEAEPMMRRALEIGESAFGSDHPEVAKNLNNLARLLQATNRLSEAESMMRRALEIHEAAFGPDHPEVATNLNNLAQLLQDTDQLEEAEPMMRRALEIEEATNGPDHPDVATNLSNLAQLLKAMDRLAEAEPLMRRALEIDEAAFGPEHPDVARDLNNLTGFLYATNRLAEAEPIMRRALEIEEATFGPDHPNVARTLNNLAYLLQATNRLSEAEPMMRRALEIDKAAFGTTHPRIATRLNNLAQLLRATNRLAEAEPMIRRALEIWARSLGPDHLNTQMAQENLEILLAEIASDPERQPPE